MKLYKNSATSEKTFGLLSCGFCIIFKSYMESHFLKINWEEIKEISILGVTKRRF